MSTSRTKMIGAHDGKVPALNSTNAPTFFVCTNCGIPYPDEALPFRCAKCGGHFDFRTPLRYEHPEPDDGGRGIGRFRKTYPLTSDMPFASLGEGGTPLVEVQREGRSIFLKCEHLNPTGSFKDRGTAVLINALRQAGVTSALEDSSGNAGASFAAYAARAGIDATIFVPDYASGPKKAQIQAYGAQIVAVPGPRSATSEAVRLEAEKGRVYASHTYLPHGIAGMATVAYELVEQLGTTPGALLIPVGQGTLLLGVYRGFVALQAAGVVERIPALIGVQASACAPIWAVHTSGAAGLGWVQEGTTIAEGVRILQPLRGDAVLQAVEASAGRMLAVEEQHILPARDELAGQGLYVEPTSAIVWAALAQVIDQLVEPVVLVLTGHGLKSALAS